MNPFVLKSLCVLVLIIAAIMLAYANYYRRKEIYYELLEPSIRLR
jgi:putative effector of murein hydrolase